MISEYEVLGKLFLAILFGGLVGLQRELDDQYAGLRTHMLVCAGSTLFTLLSLGFPDSDPSRVAAGIVTGIGFLGAGAIFKEKDKVVGLTTAADLWVIAAIGMAVGMGYYLVAAFSTALILVVLILKKIFFPNKKTGKILHV
ncbi:MAG: MgtC/SapB family protein [Candidatus Diapherotrites archaeon]